MDCWRSKLSLVVAAFTLFVALDSAALPRPADRNGSDYTDAELDAIIEHDLERVHIKDKRVEVLGGIVTLRGEVSSVGEKNEASTVASKVAQVKRVENEIDIVWDASDSEIAQEVVERLNGYVHYTIYDGVQSEVRDGVLHLSGRVTQPFKSGEIANFLSRVPGVRAIQNEIRALPFVPSDENLRVGIAVSLYQALPDYAMVPAVPIHVVVENARVTLEGAVRTEEDRGIAERVARAVPGVVDVENRLGIIATP
jgi:osmotically-inducible protein OsmY